MSNLGKYIQFKNGKSSPERDEPGGFPVFGSNGIIGHSSKYNSDNGTIVIGRVGSYCGSVHYSSTKCWVTDNAIIATPIYKDESLFWFYYLKSLNLNMMKVGSGQPLLNQKILSSLPLQNIENIDKKHIGNILFGFDQKIQLNTQTNQTLEQIAQAIYKSWFVEYEPTRAKAAVLAAGGSKAEAETAAMRAISGKTAADLAAPAQTHPPRYQQLATLAQAFPAALVPTDGFGEIPEGWEVSTIGESVETVGGATPSTKEESFWLNGDIHWTTPKDLSNLTDNILIDTNKKITAQGLKKISSGLLPVNTVLMSSRAPVGYLALTKIPVAINQGYIAIKPFGKLSCYYMIQWCYSNMEEIKGRAIGTTFAEISKTNFRGMKIVVPPKFVLAAYNKIIEPIYNRITSNNYESKQLSNTRDLLLPKLLSNGIL